MLVPPHIHSRPLLVVPALQVQQLLREINAYFDSDFSLLKECPKGFVLEFQDDGTPQPIFLGQISSREAKDYYESQIRNERLTRYLAGKEEKNAFEEKIRDGIDATRNKKKSKVERKQERRHAELDWEICLARVQCYFGLLDSDRERIDKSSEDVMIPLYLPTFNLEQPVSFPMWKTPIFISIDVESNEVAHSQVTEVGISILDTLDLAGVAPGEAGKNWMSRISARHFRVRDYAHIVNTKYVLGCPDRFEFGQSEWVALADLAKEVDACFNYYLAKVMMERDAAPELKERGIIIVGHNVPFDVKYLRNVGSTFLENHEASRIIDTVDTALLFRMWKREQHIRSLGNILTEFDVIPWYLHNAGNDARYTLEAMVHIALKAREGAKEYGAYVEVKYQDRYDIEGEWM